MRLTIALLAAAAATGATAQEPPSAPLKETVISDKENAGWGFQGKPKLKEVPAEQLPGGKALQVAVAKGANPWDTQGLIPLKQGIEQGDLLTFGFFARSVSPDAGSIHVRFQRNGAPYDSAFEGPVQIDHEWRFVCLVGTAGKAIPAAELDIAVQLAGEKRVVELGPYLATRIPAGAAAKKSGLPCGVAPAVAP